MKILTASLTKPGGKEVNEDFCGWSVPETGIGCWVLADGQSNEGGGNMVAQRVVTNMLGNFQANPAISRTILANVFEWAQRDVVTLQTENPGKSLRVSVAMFCSGGRSALWAHIGDVRVYAFRDGELICRTNDHTVSQALVYAGEIRLDEIRIHADRNRLLGCLGSQGKSHPTVLESKFLLETGDLFLICTNGFWEYVTELEMQADWCKSRNPSEWLEKMEIRLLMAAQPGHDNYSAIALLVD